LQSGELIGIDETELRGFLKSIPEIWFAKRRFLERGIDLLLSNFIDCEHKLTSTHIYNCNTGFLLLFTEFLKDIRAATFKVHAYIPWLASFTSDEVFETRFMKIILEYSDKDMSAFRELATLRIFICPMCHAQYSLRVLQTKDDGSIQCQNCGKFVRVTELHSEYEMECEDSEEDETAHL
jgi:hypothetical protein